MEPTRDDIAATLQAATGFRKLSDADREELAGRLTAESFLSGATVLELGRVLEHVYIIHSGSLEVRSATGKVFARLKPGDVLGARALSRDQRLSYRAVATEDSVILKLPREEFESLQKTHPKFETYFDRVGFERGRSGGIDGLPARDAAIDLMTTTARDLMTAGPVTAEPEMPLLAAARLMRQRKVSCLPVIDSERVVGIITDRDLRNRVVAEAADLKRPARDFMTKDPVTLDCDALAFDALVLMMKHDVSHLPLISDERLVGILTHTNLVRAQSRSAVYMIGEIHRYERVADMAAVVRQNPGIARSPGRERCIGTQDWPDHYLDL